MSKVLITGITGFVGSALARALAAEGAELFGLVRPSSDRSRLDGLPVTWMEGDVTVRESLAGVFDWVDGVIHAAGMLGRAGVPESAYHQLHVNGTSNVLGEIEKLDNPPKVLYVSSPGVLGPINGPPADENAPPAPSNAYERSKAAAEMVTQIFARQGTPVVITRPEFIYGPTDMHVLGLFQAIQKGRFFTIDHGRATCHPTYIDDAVDGMLRCLKQGRHGQVYHIAGPEPVTFRALADTIATAVGVPPPTRNLPHWLAMAGATALEIGGALFKTTPPLSRDGVAFFSDDRRFSWQKAHHELGYTPRFSLTTGVVRTVAWYQEKGLLEKM
ncbi:MAG: NAD-dependent epimerase/dehydratase family protein [Chloroflexi bacterium]|nr:NAD-dependent epimerase/dehydratase family protein [Ardenticatenaceae bacterium]MBL1128336.1 NAD-dependent epimerase/dehydratase family protein [Chloroflexota bacterium]NOG34411.1 NAD-dependent epimerase/dehydratase family protein [Chloroflexota bacterium]GIK57702.1 MAG: NAD-dependent epimerase [Chloroflexota bacterium]